MGISFGSLASGLPPDIVDKLIDAERQPIKMLEKNKANLEAQEKLLSDLKTRVNSVPYMQMKDIYSFKEMQAMSANPEILTATVDKRSAVPGTYNIEVIQLAKRPSAMSTAFPDKDKTQVGVGYLEFERADGKKESIFISPSNNTLEGVARAINNAKLGFIASIVDDGLGESNHYRILMSGQNSGDNEAVKWPQFYFLDGDEDFYIDKENPAQDAKVKIDGFELEVPENKIKDMLPGLNIDLHKAEPGKEISLSVKEDLETMTGKVKNFVESVNKVIDFIQTQNSLTAESNTKNTLGGDITLSTMESRIRSVMLAPVPGSTGKYNYATHVGISFQRNGRIAFDEKKFADALNKDFQSVARLFVGTGEGNSGLIPLLGKEFMSFTRPGDGILSTRETGLKNRIRSIDRTIASKETMLARKKDQLKNTFANLESNMAGLKSQANYVSSALSNMPSASNINMGSAQK